jgi:GntR family transcriptional regulator
MTVRQALADLRRTGHILTDKGRGSVVAQPRIEQSLLQFYSFGRRFRASGDDFTSTLVEQGSVDSGAVVDDHFGGQRCYRIVRLRALSGVPFMLETAYLPQSVFPGILDQDLAGASLYDLLERVYQHPVHGAREYLEPRIVEGDQARLLQVPDGSPVFYTERYSRDTAGLLIEVRTSLIRGDRLRFSAELPVGGNSAYDTGIQMG